MGWKDRAIPVDDVVESNAPSSWRDRATPAGELESPQNSPITAATTGIIQGAVPFAGALAGAGKAGLNAISGVTGPLAGGSLSDIVDDYRKSRDEFSQDAKTAADANPKTALLGNLAGGIANPLFKGAQGLGGIATAGGIQALGRSDADLTKGDLKQAAKDTVLGAAAGGLGYGAAKAVPKLWEGVKYFGKKALTNLGPSEEAISARLAGRAQDTAKSYPELAEEMKGSVKDLQGQISNLSEDAAQSLSTEPTIPKVYVTDVLDNSIKDLGTLIGPKDKQAASALKGLQGDLSQLNGTVSESELKTLIKKLDDNINWDDQSQNKLNTILENVRTQIDDKLKFQNPTYRHLMEPVADRARLLTDLKRQFNFKGVPGEGLVPSDATASNIQSSLRENKAVTQSNLDKLNQFTGQDYQDLAKDYQLAQQFDKTSAQGSKRTVLGGAIGSLLGSGLSPGVGTAIGTAAGAGAGATLDRYGGKVAGNLIDSYLAAGNSAAFGKFKPVIEKAAKEGPQALAFISAMLASNPEFKKQMHIDEEPLETPLKFRVPAHRGGR